MELTLKDRFILSKKGYSFVMWIGHWAKLFSAIVGIISFNTYKGQAFWYDGFVLRWWIRADKKKKGIKNDD